MDRKIATMSLVKRFKVAAYFRLVIFVLLRMVASSVCGGALESDIVASDKRRQKEAQRMDREIFQQFILVSGAIGDWAGGEVVRRANGLGEPCAAEEALRAL